MAGRPFAAAFQSKAVTHSYGVSFCSQQYIGPEFLSRDHAHLSLLLELLQQDYLHPRIREKGGAYGTGAKVTEARTVALSSYLDPNALQTFDIFDESVEELLSKQSIEGDKLKEAKILQLGRLDRPKTPQAEGLGLILKNYTSQDFETFRSALK
jgi:presequence protease